MATYYLVGNGNWNNSAIWSLTNGGAGGAGVPGAGDRAIMNGSRTVSLVANTTVDSIYGTINNTGTFNTANYNLNVLGTVGFQWDGGTLNLGSSVLTVASMNTANAGGTKNVSVGTSRVVAYDTGVVGTFGSTAGTPFPFATLEVTDINIRFGNLTADSIIAIKETSSASTILATSGVVATVKRMVLKGFDTGSGRQSIYGGNPNKLTLNTGSTNQIFVFQNVTIARTIGTGAGDKYVEPGSLDGGDNTGLTFSSAPLVESLVDNFTGSALNTTRWTSSTVSGGYATVTSNRLDIGGVNSSSSVTVSSRDQYLLEGSSATFFLSRVLGGSGYGQFDIANSFSQYGVSSRRNLPSISVLFDQTTISLSIIGATSFIDSVNELSDVYIRVKEVSGRIQVDTSTDGITFTNRFDELLSDYGIESTQIIARPIFQYLSGNSGYYSVSKFNVPLEPAASFTPTTASGTQPLTVNFTDTSNFSPTSWSWNFGDSTTSTLQNPSKTYNLPGTYSVSLTASNSSYTRSTGGTVTVSPAVYETGNTGFLKFQGGVTPTKTDYISISGSLKFQGEVRAIVYREPTALDQKSFLWKVYDPNGVYLGSRNDVITLPTWTEEVNSTGSSVELEIAVNSDSLAQSTMNMLDENGNPVLDSNSFNVLTTVETNNQIGPDTLIDYNNRMDLYVFYGSTGPILDENGLPIQDENDEDIIGVEGAPNGIRRFSGFISEINSKYGGSDTTDVTLLSYGFDLDQYLVMNGSDTTVPYNSLDPSQIVRNALNNFKLQGIGTYTDYDNSTVLDTGTVVSYTFRQNTIKQVLDKAVELAPTNWYYAVDLGNNLVTFKQRSAQPRHLFVLGKHLFQANIRGSIANAVNDVLFVGGVPDGEELNLYKRYTVVPAPRVRRGLYNYSDNRVTLESSADILSESKIEDGNQKHYKSTIAILDKLYDIESIRVGQTVGFRNFGNYVDEIVMQIVGLTYTPDVVTLQLDTLSPSVNKRLEDLRRNLTLQENANTADQPS